MAALNTIQTDLERNMHVYHYFNRQKQNEWIMSSNANQKLNEKLRPQKKILSLIIIFHMSAANRWIACAKNWKSWKLDRYSNYYLLNFTNWDREINVVQIIVKLSNAFLCCSNGKKTDNDCLNRKFPICNYARKANHSYGRL